MPCRTRTVQRLAWAALAAAGVAAAAAPARADPAYDLKLRLAADQQWSFDQSAHLSTQVQLGTGAPPVQQAADQKRSGTATILAARDGVPTAIRVAFGPDCGQSATQNGQPHGQPFPLTGKTVTVKKDDLGVVEIDGADADPATTAELTNLLTPDRSLFPPHPVAVGDQWPGDAAAVAKEMGLGPADSVTVTCRLTRIGAVAGRPTADVALDVVGTRTDAGVTTKMTLAGQSQVDLATGQTLQSDLAGKLDVTGQADTPQGSQAVQGDGKIELHTSARPVGGPPAVAPVAQSAAAAPPAADAGRFAGKYKNDRITLELAPAPAGGLVGTITMGDKSFPAVAHVDADRLAGTFDSGGHSFDFTATADGPTLRLSSGQNVFTLQRDAPPNPLDALGGGGPAPVNPLGR